MDLDFAIEHLPRLLKAAKLTIELTLLSLCEVLLAPLWVWLFLGESASKLTFIGGFILLIAITFNSLNSIMKRKRILKNRN